MDDLSAVLTGPSGATETIAGLTSGTFTTSAFAGDPLAGTWTLEITDSQNQSPHVLDSWSLVATPQAAGATASQATSAVDVALLAWFDADSSNEDRPNLLATQAANDLAMLLVP